MRKIIFFLLMLFISQFSQAQKSSSVFIEQRLFGSNRQISATGIGWMLNKSKFHMRTSLGIHYDKLEETEYRQNHSNSLQALALLAFGAKFNVGKQSSLCLSIDIGGERDYELIDTKYQYVKKNDFNFTSSFSTIFYRNISDMVFVGIKFSPVSYRLLIGQYNNANHFNFSVIPGVFLALPL